MRRLAVLALLLAALPACQGGDRSRPPARETAPPGETRIVPDLRGKDVAAARALLSEAGLLVGAVEPWPDSLGYAAGTVVAQRPMHQTPVAPGSVVDLRVFGITDEDARRAMEPPPQAPEPPPLERPSAEPMPPPPPAPPRRSAASPVVPDLVGLSLEEATRVARAAGFEVIALRVGGGTKGQVLSQDQPAGQTAPAGTPIGVRVSTGE